MLRHTATFRKAVGRGPRCVLACKGLTLAAGMKSSRLALPCLARTVTTPNLSRNGHVLKKAGTNTAQRPRLRKSRGAPRSLSGLRRWLAALPMRMAKSAGLGGALSGVYGFLSGEGGAGDRADAALDSAKWGAGIGALIPVAGSAAQKVMDRRAASKAISAGAQRTYGGSPARSRPGGIQGH